MFSLLGFIANHLGFDNVGDTPGNKGQCVGLIECWLDANQLPHVWGDAKDLLANADVRRYHVTRNTPANVPPPGSVIVWDGSWGSGHGHCAVVIAANVQYFASFEQNNPIGAGCGVKVHGYACVLGWLTW
jgi:hypothetical protein